MKGCEVFSDFRGRTVGPRKLEVNKVQFYQDAEIRIQESGAKFQAWWT